MNRIKELIKTNHNRIMKLYETEMIIPYHKGRDLIKLGYDINESSQNYYTKFESTGLINGNKPHEPYMVLETVPSVINFYKEFYDDSYCLMTLNQIKYYKNKFGIIFSDECIQLHNLLSDKDVLSMLNFQKKFVPRDLFSKPKIHFLHKPVSNSIFNLFQPIVEKPIIVGQIIENETYPLFVLIA